MYLIKAVLILTSCAVMIQAPPGHSVQCLSCQGVSDTSDCHHYHKCHHDEVCKVTARTSHGHIVYDLGCSHPDDCHSGKRSTLCRHCCSSSSTCHKHSCDQKSTTVPTTTTKTTTTSPATTHPPGMRCLHCSHVDDVNHCHSYTTCRYGEYCSTHTSTVSGKTTYTLGCMSSTLCRRYATKNKRFIYDSLYYGRIGQCIQCCHGSSSCGRSLCKQPTTTPTTTTTTTTTTPAPTTRKPAMKCLACQMIDDIKKCTRYQTCNSSQECATIVTSVDGRLKYSFSCLTPESCQYLSYRVTKRQSSRETNTIKCAECCSSHQACNSRLCHQFNMLTTTTPTTTTKPTTTTTTKQTTTKQPETTSNPTTQYLKTATTVHADVTTKKVQQVIDPHCRDYEEDGFYCGSFDIFYFCTDKSSFAHSLAHEKCPKHCGFCTPEEGNLVAYIPPEVPVHSADKCADYEQDGFMCSNYDHTHFCTDHTSIAYVVANEKCRKHCGFCTDGTQNNVTTTVQTTPEPVHIETTTEPPCVDHEQAGLTCADLDTVDICHNKQSASYIIAHQLCRKYCGLCTSNGEETTHGPVLIPTKPAMIIPTHPPSS